ncbi:MULTISPECIES: PTS fructose transporter subunit IIC [Oceanobacillus]|uniref:PTS fructose transporter subunit IIBC n=1 Tax=Oceanobacillus sojae TaxID=582851 RepID=A0A511ZH02_9BACI|nr:fructose-specific PTS transporter subunit EIIC [Oceanobacillus sojae]GEN86711.1 PTS fructose transporter subunit IIBC [Oceanobacillus sojae]
MTRLVAVTTCPTGVAHTYMAAEAIIEAAKEKDIWVKVETQGALGAENILSEDEIMNADVVLIASGKKVNKDRFEGKKVFEADISRAIKDAAGLIDEAFQSAKVQENKISESPDGKETKNKELPEVYKHLMTGVSFMTPVVVAGGILLAISFIWGLDSSTEGDPSYNPIAAALNLIGGGDGALGLMVPVLAAGIAYSIANRAGITSGLLSGLIAQIIGAGFLGGIIGGFLAGYITKYLIKWIKVPKSIESIKAVLLVPVLSVGLTGLILIFVIGTPIAALLDILETALSNLETGNKILLGIITGSMMAFDMGGPLNKSIFAFSMIAFAEGNYEPFAAVMAGGVTPPLALALSTILFKNKYSVEEKEMGKSAWILGASNITEGAIPFAVSDPLRVIPCIMIGSSVSSTLSLIFEAACRVPHGGLWATLIPNVFDNPLLWVFGICCGTVVGAILLGLVKKGGVHQ